MSCFRRVLLQRLPVIGLARWIHMSSQQQLRYGWWAYVLGESSLKKFTDYSKIITVDGNLASGKGQLAQQLAKKLGLRHFPEPDEHFLDRITGDGTILDSKFSGYCSLEKFYNDPKSADGNSYRLQLWMYNMRILQYSDALEHLLSTGQGVILERSPFSDYVFLEAMLKENYIRKECLAHYNEIKGISIDEFLPPHLVIYVDVPVADIHKRFKTRTDPMEKNISTSYLQSIEDSYKKNFLPQISETSEILQYSSSEIQDVEKVFEDIEYLKFDKKPWVEQTDVSLHHLRMLVEDKQRVANLMTIPLFIPEVTIGALEFDRAYYQYRSLPGRKYGEGYNADIGDKWIWLK
ncbi:NADH dehydrogenase [ubiquinone] 1 alpha subcomplex subunit 10, mitochondrial [Rhinatrema bivittatum]|uniref:NADH dehydrogenase [ubiquinone] 1 alpha subcomplex subunit 10, mitochondrial n=1 Tax=Rhinatrema bivittatum TaxID=194408 RepID=UPI001129EBE8|nr:NADH dehydrogenase [ubiquinone] 1 alpha subcomplex subunit 10, mitochondrial [Rhinatrema bivittatum]